jgi:hypothetical protein
MTPPQDPVFLLDIENALLDNDWIELDLRRHQSDQPVSCAAGVSGSHRQTPSATSSISASVGPTCSMFSRSDVTRYLYVGHVLQPRGSDLVAPDQETRGPRFGTEWPARRRGNPVTTPLRQEAGRWQS